MSMALTGASYYGKIKWSIFSRLLFAASFFGFIIPGWQSDIWAAIAVAIGFFATPQIWRQVIEALPFRKDLFSRAKGKEVNDNVNKSERIE